MKQRLIITTLIAVLAVVPTFLGCQGEPEIAEISVSSLTITPSEVLAGDEVTISVDVTNVGSAPGIYEGTLTVGGEEVETKSIAVPGRTKEILTFTLVEDVSGIYDISVDGLSGVLTVMEEVELKYDDGRPDGVIRLYGPGSGYLVNFSPPDTSFTINRVKIYGCLYGTISPVQKFEVQIWDKDKEIIATFNYSYVAFSQTPTWVELQVADTKLSDYFYVHLCPTSTEASGVQVFFDSSKINTHSEVTINWQIAESWYPEVPKDQVNWMIRVEGTIIGTTE